MSKIEREQSVSHNTSGAVGVDTLIIGSVVEFGRSEDGKRGLFNKDKVERAQAKVAVRLVDVRTRLVFHSATGSGEATTATHTILGMGSTSRFDGTLTDKALSVAVEDMLESLINTLAARPWRADVLVVENGQIFISGGGRQGLSVGDRLRLVRAGKLVKSAQTGFEIALPPTDVGVLEVVSMFGDSETNEGSITRLVSGSLAGLSTADLVVLAP